MSFDKDLPYSGECAGVGPDSEAILLMLPQGLHAKYQVLAKFINDHTNDGSQVSPDQLITRAILSHLEGVLSEVEIPGL